VPPVLIKPIAKPGSYQVRLTVDGVSQTKSFDLKLNPNETYSRAETDAKATFWMELYAKAGEGVQAILDAQAAQAKVKEASQASAATDEIKAQAAIVDELSQEFIGSMVATGRTLVQIISEPTKPLSKLVTLHNVMESSEGPPNEPLREVYAKTAAEIDTAIAEFRTALDAEMAAFDKLADN
jgi:hypothetical protein